MTDIKELEAAIKSAPEHSKYLILDNAARAHLKLLQDIANGKVKIVPIQPTEEMINKASINFNGIDRCYIKMLSVAPDYFLTNSKE